MTESMIRYQTTFESTQNLPMVIALGHGENADLIAGITDNGIEVDLTDYTARAIYQPSSKFGTDDWYECPCEKVGNTVVVHWGHTYDNGDNAVIMWLHFMKDGKVAYPALYKIKLFETPGFTPSAIEPIPEVIDFSQYTLLNAPWALQSDFNVLSGNVDVLSEQVSNLEIRLPYSPIEIYADDSSSEFVVTLSGRHVYGVHPLIGFTTGFAFDPIFEQGEIFDCVVYIDNRNNSDSLGFDMSYNNSWVVDDGVEFSDLQTPANTLRCYYFTQTPLGNSGIVSHLSFKDLVELQH